MHVIQFFLPPLAVAGLSAGMLKLLWWRRLRTAGYLRLAGWPALAGAFAWTAVLLWTDTDGTIPGYGLLVLAIAVTQVLLLRRLI